MQPGATSGPQGAIGATISEGIGLVKGKSPGEYAKIQKSPIEATAATFGEVVGMATLSGLYKGASRTATKRIIKPSIRYSPKVLKKLSSITGKPKLYNKLSKSKTLKRAYRWADDDLTKARVYKQSKVKQASSIKERKGIKYDYWAKKETYKPTRKTTWMTPDEVKTFKAKLKPESTVTTRMTQTSQTLRQSMLSQIKQGKKTFRRYKFKQASIEARKTVPTNLRATTKLKPFTKSSLYKQKPISSSIIKQQPSFYKKMLQKGYSYKRPTSFVLKDSKMAKFYGSADDFIKGPPTKADQFVKGFGKSDLIQSSKYYGGKITKTTKNAARKILDDISAQATLTRPSTKLTYRTPLSKSTYKTQLSYSPTTTMKVPVKTNIPISSISTSLSSAIKSAQTQKLIPQYETSKTSINASKLAYKPIKTQKQPQIQAQLFIPATSTKYIPSTSTKITTITPQETTTKTTPPTPSYYQQPFKTRKPTIYTPQTKKKKKRLPSLSTLSSKDIYGERTFKIYKPKKVKL